MCTEEEKIELIMSFNVTLLSNFLHLLFIVLDFQQSFHFRIRKFSFLEGIFQTFSNMLSKHKIDNEIILPFILVDNNHDVMVGVVRV